MNPRDTYIVTESMAGKSSREIGAALNITHQAVLSRLKRLQPAMEILEARACSKAAREHALDLGVIAPRKRRSMEDFERVKKPTISQAVQTLFEVYGYEGCRKLSHVLTHRLADRRYRMKQKAKAKEIRALMNACALKNRL